MNRPVGKRTWGIAEAYLPAWSRGPTPEMASHETLCILNTGAETARITLTIFFHDRDPAGPYRLEVPARRTRHLRLDELNTPEPIPRTTDYAALLESSVPIVVQHTRLDSRQSENALFSTVAFASD